MEGGGLDQKWLMGKWPFSLFFGVRLDAYRVKDPLLLRMPLATATCLGPQAASYSVELHASGIRYVPRQPSLAYSTLLL